MKQIIRFMSQPRVLQLLNLELKYSEKKYLYINDKIKKKKKKKKDP